ncbi:hypothetical protein DCO57_18025 [Labrenzia sp. 011]|nr:hypothetical protein DCO57_18025 [Labrenzia sp. 011]
MRVVVMPVTSIEPQSKHLRLNINALLLSTIVYFCVLGLSFKGIGALDAFLVNLILGILVFAFVFFLSVVHGMFSLEVDEWALSDKWTSVLTYVWSLSVFIALLDLLISEVFKGHLFIAGLFGQGFEVLHALSYSVVAGLVLLTKSVLLFRGSGVRWKVVLRDLSVATAINTVFFYLMVERLPEYFETVLKS